MKQFKGKYKQKKKSKIVIVLFFFLFMFSYVYAVNYFKTNKLKDTILTNDYNYINSNIIEVIETSIEDKINNPVNILNNNVKAAVKKEANLVTSKTNNTSSIDTYEPIIYIYNTHQSESYSNYSVYELSNYLSELLSKDKIDNYFEVQSVNTFLSDNNLKYYKSYTVSRKYMKEAMEKYNTLKYFIDIHRDSVSKDRTTIIYNNKNYARILFIVGLDNPNYNDNLNNTTIINNKLEELVPGISRGIMQKQGKTVDGIYNQDISSNVFLIEVGGVSNTKEEVINSILVIKEVLEIYIRGTL